MQDLKRCVKQYRDLDDEIRHLNKQLQPKREERQRVADEMSDILADPTFAEIDKLKMEDDGSTIRIQRPNTYNKPWSLSKKEFENLVRAYFATTITPTSDGCIQYVFESRKRALVATTFDFTRLIPDE